MNFWIFFDFTDFLFSFLPENYEFLGVFRFYRFFVYFLLENYEFLDFFP